jgi:hypothetical protein
MEFVMSNVNLLSKNLLVNNNNTISHTHNTIDTFSKPDTRVNSETSVKNRIPPSNVKSKSVLANKNKSNKSILMKNKELNLKVLREKLNEKFNLRSSYLNTPSGGGKSFNLNFDLFKPLIPSSTKSDKKSFLYLYNKNTLTDKIKLNKLKNRSTQNENSKDNEPHINLINTENTILITENTYTNKNLETIQTHLNDIIPPKCSRKEFLINELQASQMPEVESKNESLLDKLNLIKLRASNLIGKLVDDNRKVNEKLKTHIHSKSNHF